MLASEITPSPPHQQLHAELKLQNKNRPPAHTNGSRTKRRDATREKPTPEVAVTMLIRDRRKKKGKEKKN